MISAGSPQDILTRTCMRSCKDLLEDFGSLQERLTRSCTRLWQFDQDLHARTPKRIQQIVIKRLALLEKIFQDLDTRTSQEHPRRAKDTSVAILGPTKPQPPPLSHFGFVKSQTDTSVTHCGCLKLQTRTPAAHLTLYNSNPIPPKRTLHI